MCPQRSRSKFFRSGQKTDGLYRIAGEALKCPELRANIAACKISLAEAHRVLGHISYGAVKSAIKAGQVSGIQIDENTDEVFCDACAKAKPHHKPFPDHAQNCAEKLGERVRRVQCSFEYSKVKDSAR
jgi:hypothetical protein